MPLDNRTLIFALILVSAMMSISLFVVARQNEREGLHRWGAAMAMMAFGWMLVEARGLIPDLASTVLANVLFSTAISLELAAIYQYRGQSWPFWSCIAPVIITMLVFLALPMRDMRGHLMASSLIYGVQLFLLARALYGDRPSRTGHAWWLIFSATVSALPVLALRGLAAYFGPFPFADLRSVVAPNPVQIVTFVFIMVMITLGSLGFILMIKERTDREIRKQALTDPLTGVLNRRAFLEHAERELAFAQRKHLPLSLIMLDVDHFKAINDRHGHLVGDNVLVDLAHRLSRRLRTQDIIGRYGGEEFCVLLPGTDDTGVHMAAESLRQVIASATLVEDTPVTISLGTSAYEPVAGNGSIDFSILLESADNALYQAKHEGRNRTIQSQRDTGRCAAEVAGG